MSIFVFILQEKLLMFNFEQKQELTRIEKPRISCKVVQMTNELDSFCKFRIESQINHLVQRIEELWGKREREREKKKKGSTSPRKKQKEPKLE